MPTVYNLFQKMDTEGGQHHPDLKTRPHYKQFLRGETGSRRAHPTSTLDRSFLDSSHMLVFSTQIIRDKEEEIDVEKVTCYHKLVSHPSMSNKILLCVILSCIWFWVLIFNKVNSRSS